MLHHLASDLFSLRWTFSKIILHLMVLFDHSKLLLSTWPPIRQHLFKIDTGNLFTTTVGQRSKCYSAEVFHQ